MNHGGERKRQGHESKNVCDYEHTHACSYTQTAIYQ